jgi:hypothetical protein
MQKEAMMGGLPIVTAENVYETATEVVKASDFSSPDRFFTHPSSPKAPKKGPPQPDVTVMAAEQMKTQSAEKIKQLEVQQKEMDSQRDAELAKYQTDVDADVKLRIAAHNAETGERMERVKGEVGAGIEQIKSNLNPKTLEAKAKTSEVQQQGAVIEKFMAAQEARDQATAELFKEVISTVRSLAGPKRVVRGKDNRIERLEPVQ